MRSTIIMATPTQNIYYLAYTNVPRRHTTLQAESLIDELGLGLSSKKLRKAMTALDPGGDGVVQKDDFLAWYAENAESG